MVETIGGLVALVLAFLAYGWKQKRDGRAEQKKEAENAAKDAISDARRARLDAASGELRDDDGFRRD